MKNVLITGATGFVGANLARRLLYDGHKVNLLNRPNSSCWRIEEIRKDVSIHSVSLLDQNALCGLVQTLKPEWIFHLAVHGAYSSQTNLDEMVQTNIVGTMNLVRACLTQDFEAFINTGSSSEYGFKTEAPSEISWLEPNSHYAVTKAAATHVCRYTAQSNNVHMITLRLYSAYGPFEEPSRFVPTLIRHALEGGLPPLVNPDIARDYVFIDDVIDAYVLAASEQGQELGAVYNVGTGVQTSIRQAVSTAKRLLGLVAEPSWGSMEDRIWDSTSWVADNSKIRAALSWKPNFTFERGFCSTVDWTRSNLEKACVQR